MRLDPEDMREVITTFQNACRTAIGHYDGFIARYMGDGMLIYFGYPRAHEDDAARAVRAGLAVVEAVTALNQGGSARNDVSLAVRVGVATGPVVVGDIVGEGAAEEAAVIGETPNLAARLQGLAEPNRWSSRRPRIGCWHRCSTSRTGGAPSADGTWTAPGMPPGSLPHRPW
ncbi:MAG: adenylate/guanylate cyclase domain-containing protein [Gammaproteobacteria bacterium]|nr:adenylate/guanylate cyclase domain-containing protein [Gammaproteobacteria bacterium]